MGLFTTPSSLAHEIHDNDSEAHFIGPFPKGIIPAFRLSPILKPQGFHPIHPFIHAVRHSSKISQKFILFIPLSDQITETPKPGKTNSQKGHNNQIPIPAKSQRPDPNHQLQHSLRHRHLPMVNSHLICQQLINMPPMRLHQHIRNHFPVFIPQRLCAFVPLCSPYLKPRPVAGHQWWRHSIVAGIGDSAQIICCSSRYKVPVLAGSCDIFLA